MKNLARSSRIAAADAPDGRPTPTADARRRIAEKTAALKPAIIKAISTVFDPEIPVNIWELGLIYDVFVDAQRRRRRSG